MNSPHAHCLVALGQRCLSGDTIFIKTLVLLKRYLFPKPLIDRIVDNAIELWLAVRALPTFSNRPLLQLVGDIW